MSGSEVHGYDVAYWISKERFLHTALSELILPELRTALASIPVLSQLRSGALALRSLSLPAITFLGDSTFEVVVRAAASAITGFGRLPTPGTPAQTYTVPDVISSLTTLSSRLNISLATLQGLNPQITSATALLGLGQVITTAAAVAAIAGVPDLAPTAIGEATLTLPLRIGIEATNNRRDVIVRSTEAAQPQLSGLPDVLLTNQQLDPLTARRDLLGAIISAVGTIAPGTWTVFLPAPLGELCSIAPRILDVKLLPAVIAERNDALAFFLTLLPDVPVGRKDEFRGSMLPQGNDLRLDLASRLLMRLICCALPKAPQMAGMRSEPSETTESGCTWRDAGTINVDGTDYHIDLLAVSIGEGQILVEGQLRAGDFWWGWGATARFKVRITLRVDVQSVIVAEIGEPEVEVDFWIEWWVWLLAAVIAIVLAIIGGLILGGAAIGVIVGVIFLTIEAVALVIGDIVGGAVIQGALGSFGERLTSLQILPDDLTAAFGAIRPQAVSIDDVSIAGQLIPPRFNSASFRSQAVPTTVTAGERFGISIEMRNTGARTWTSSPDQAHRLGAQSPQDNATWGTRRLSLPGAVRPGSVVTVGATLTAPATPGVYSMQWRMVQEGVEWFGDSTPMVSLTVVKPKEKEKEKDTKEKEKDTKEKDTKEKEKDTKEKDTKEKEKETKERDKVREKNPREVEPISPFESSGRSLSEDASHGRSMARPFIRPEERPDR